MAQPTNQPVPGYPQPRGEKYDMMWDHYGPSSYSNKFTNSGTGDAIVNTDLGVGGFERVGVSFGGYSQSGNYWAKAILTAASNLGSAAPKFTLIWYSVSPAFSTVGNEVSNTTDLSAETVRLDASVV